MTDLANVQRQIESFRDHPALLTWYISDEPDGPGIPPSAIRAAHDLAHHLDPYHPTSLVLNCRDYHFTSYAVTDIVMLDVYHIALNAAWSKKYNTPITPHFGASGCDGCNGTFCDVVNRVEEARERLAAMGRARTSIWLVPQGFDDHGEEFWWRVPMGSEVAAQVVLGVIHGITGVIGWLASSATDDIMNVRECLVVEFGAERQNVSMLAGHLHRQERFLLSAADTRRIIHPDLTDDSFSGLDIAAWTVGGEHDPDTALDELVFGQFASTAAQQETLIFAVNFNYAKEPVEFHPFGVTGNIKQVLFGDIVEQDGGLLFRMPGMSIAGVILQAHRRETPLEASAPSRGSIVVDQASAWR